MRAIAGCLPFAVLLLAGCARRLPGPEECRAFALATLGLPRETPAAALARNPALAARAENVTRTCLTTPWDYQLLQCLEQGNQQLCLARFERRRALRATHVE